MAQSDASDSPTTLSRVRLRCICGEEYNRDEHRNCPNCGGGSGLAVAEGRFVTDDDDLTVSCDWVFVSRSGSHSSAVAAGVGEPVSEGHRAHLAESLHVRDTDAEIRRDAWPDPTRVADRASFLVFVSQLSARLAANGRLDAAALLEKAGSRAARPVRAGKLDPARLDTADWRQFAAFLLAGTRS